MDTLHIIFQVVGWTIAVSAYMTLFIYIGIKAGGIKIKRKNKKQII